jgi:hypothetical protein
MSYRPRTDHRKTDEEQDYDDSNSSGTRSRKRKSKGRYSIRKEQIYNKVKRPRTPYTLFIMDEDQRKKAEKRAGKGDLRTALVDMWYDLDDKDKEEYTRQFEDDIRRYENECRQIDEQTKGRNSVKKSSRDGEKEEN